MDSKDFLKAIAQMPRGSLDALASTILATFGVDIKSEKIKKAIDAQRAAAPKPDKFKAGGQTEAFSKSGKIRDYRDPRTSANKAPTTSPTPSGPKPQATPPRGFRDTAPAGQLNTQGVPKPAQPGSAAQMGANRARMLPAAGQSGGSKPPKGTKVPVRGGSNLPPDQARRAAVASKAAASNIRSSATGSSATPMPGSGGFQGPYSDLSARPQGPYSDVSSGRVNYPNNALNKLSKNVQQLTEQLRAATKAQGGTMTTRGTQGIRYSKPLGTTGGLGQGLLGAAIEMALGPVVENLGGEMGKTSTKNLLRTGLQLQQLIPGEQSAEERFMNQYGYTPEDLYPRGNNLIMTPSGEYYDPSKQQLVYGGVPRAKGQPSRMGESYGPPVPAAPQATQTATTPVAPSLPPKNPNQQAPVTADPGRRIRPFPNLGIEQVQPYRSSMQMR